MADFGLIALGAAEAYTDKKISQIPIPKAWLGNTTTALSEGSTANPITIDNKPVTAESGNIAAYDDTEYIFTGTVWQKFGGKFSDLTDVNVSNPTDGQIVRYNGTSGKYENSNETTYESKQAASGGTDASLCTTGEKYTWNNKQDKPTVLTGTLTTGNTSVSWTNAAITSTARYDVYTDPYIPYEDLTRSGTTFTALFEEQTGDVLVKLCIYED